MTIYTHRIGSEDPIIFNLTDDGTLIDLSTYGKVEVRMLHGSTVVAKDSANNPTEVVKSDPTNGEITLNPPTNLFAATGEYECFFWITDASGKVHAVPEHKNLIIKVLSAF